MGTAFYGETHGFLDSSYPFDKQTHSKNFDVFDEYPPVTSAASSLSPSFIFRFLPTWKRSSLSLRTPPLLKELSLEPTGGDIVLFKRELEPSMEDMECPIRDEFQPSPFPLFFMSMAKGALTTFVPEMVRETLTFLGAPQSVVHVGASVVQAGIIVCTSTSYLPTAAGMAVSGSLQFIGAPASLSSALGSTTALVTSVATGDVVTPTNLIVSLGGSVVGSTLAIKAKDKVSSWLKYSKTAAKVKSKIQSSWSYICETLDCYEG